MSRSVIPRPAPCGGGRSPSHVESARSALKAENIPKDVIRLGVADDRLMERESLGALLEPYKDLKVVRSCARSAIVHEVSSDERVDVILLDFDIDKERVFSLLTQLEQSMFRGCVLVIACAVSDTDVVRLVARGVCGVLSKAHSADLLAKCIRKVVAGELWFDQPLFRAIVRAARVVLRKMDCQEFTDREMELLRCLAQGLANKEIAARMHIEETAVKACFHRMFKKLGVHSRGQLAMIGLTRFGDELQSRAR